MFTAIDTAPVWLSIKLATITTLILLLIATPLAWWLCHSHRKLTSLIATLVTLPLVLPPSVLGFYMLLMLGENGPVGWLTSYLGMGSLAFSFQGLVVASVIYSFPFAVQPIQSAFESIGTKPLEAAATLRASPLDRFITIALPLAKPGILTAAVLSFAHTIGEFGVILMIGGSIPGQTKVLSVAIYDHVEALEYDQAYILSGGMVLFAFVVLFLLYSLNQRAKGGKTHSARFTRLE
jgi:molybdate transport system permease protein